MIGLVIKKKKKLDFSGGSVVKSLPAHVGDMGSIAGPGRFHVLQRNSAHIPQVLKPMVHNTRIHHNEKPENHN